MGLKGVWRGASRHQSLIIYRPISLFYYSSFDEWGRCGDEKDEEDRNIEQHHKNSVGNKRRNQEQTRGEGHVKKKI